jgi:primosomal protein N' (replication factor Y)
LSSRLVSVAIPIPHLGLLTYRVPDGHPEPVRGARVVVPLGSRRLAGVVLGAAPEPDPALALRDLIQTLDAGAFVPPDVVALTAWMADYYLAGPGAALATALPPRGLAGRADAFRRVRLATITPEGRDALDRLLNPRCAADGDRPRLGARQREALGLLATRPSGWQGPELAERGIPWSVVARLAGAGFATLGSERIDRDPFGGQHHLPADALHEASLRLTPEQETALGTLEGLAASAAFRVALVHGVTGSGKTEIYLRLARSMRARGRGVLVLVPEIALTPQVAARFRARFGTRVAIQHSGLSDGERHDQWHRIRRGDVDVVIGTRSAVFAPLERPGLIVVDEEHDTSYKQEETPRYHGRDVAVMRGKLCDALVVLGSATPSLESYANARAGRYSLVTLERRVGDRPLAEVRVINMRDELAAAGPDVVVSEALARCLTATVEAGEQAVVLLNRRGFATSLMCRQCGQTLDCPNCSVSLTVHRRRPSSRAGDSGARLWLAQCHYCNHQRVTPAACTQCAAPYLERVGFGTERVEAEIRAKLPSARIARVDRDTVRRRGSLVEMLGRFARRELDVLVGTQMIAKGHDFPGVTLVGVISADVGLGLADFRASERTFQLLTQVAGRAGRGDRRGEAVVQTLFPEHYSIRLACTQDYRAFYDKEIAYRLALRYPPHVAMVNVVVRASTFDRAMEQASTLAGRVRRAGARGFIVLGPAPAPLTRLRGEHRAQFFLKGTSRSAMRRAVRDALAAHPAIARKAAVDVDPVSML